MTCVEPEAAGNGAIIRCWRKLRRRISLLRKLALLRQFAVLAMRYWIGVYPLIRHELRQWRARASVIPDPVLRALAFDALSGKRGNLEGASAFSVFAPRRLMPIVTQALIAFQGAYDYVDVLSEQASPDTVANGYRLHLALVAALSPPGPHQNWYLHHRSAEDAGYLQAFVGACSAAVDRLPSYSKSRMHALEGARRIAVYQGLNNWGKGGGPQHYARWAAEETPDGSGLSWWETGAAAGSSLSIFAAIAAAADPRLRQREADAIDAAYHPWIGALHTLLDSLVDHPADVSAGHHSLVGHYASPQQRASRMQEIANMSMRYIRALSDGDMHAMLFAAMSCFYLVAPEASLPHAAEARASIVAALGEHIGPTMLIMRAREALHDRGRSTLAQALRSPGEREPEAQRRADAGEAPDDDDAAAHTIESGPRCGCSSVG
jgi:tetraprenyl-beta-curcumene synthase